MRIGELATRTGVSVRALRYYEEQNLLTSERSPSGQRRYPESAVDRVHLIQQLYAAGLPSKSIVDLLPCIVNGEVTREMLGPAFGRPESYRQPDRRSGERSGQAGHHHCHRHGELANRPALRTPITLMPALRLGTSTRTSHQHCRRVERECSSSLAGNALSPRGWRALPIDCVTGIPEWTRSLVLNAALSAMSSVADQVPRDSFRQAREAGRSADECVSASVLNRTRSTEHVLYSRNTISPTRMAAWINCSPITE